MSIINRYLTAQITYSIFLVAMALLAMFSFFDLIQELDNINKGNYGIGNIMLFVLLSLPGHVYDVVPVAVLVGTMHSLSQLSRNSELIVLRTSGLSIARITWSVLYIGLIFAFITFIIGEFITPNSEKAAQRLRLKATDSVVTQDFRSGLWIKDGNSFVNVEDVSANATLSNINIYEFDSNFRLRTITNSENGFYENNAWKLGNVTQTLINDNKISSVFFPEAQWQSLIRPELMSVLLVQPEKMSMLNLYTYISHLSENKQKTTRHQIAFLAKIIYPLACLVMMILALPFGFIKARSGGSSAKIFAGIMFGILYQVLNRIFVHLGLLNNWTPLVSTITPTLMFLIAGLIMLWWVERR